MSCRAPIYLLGYVSKVLYARLLTLLNNACLPGHKLCQCAHLPGPRSPLTYARHGADTVSSAASGMLQSPAHRPLSLRSEHSSDVRAYRVTSSTNVHTYWVTNFTEVRLAQTYRNTNTVSGT